ncbi:CubicO group peptidase (beta-lactamase class C family) [Agromyces sp. 3263]|uniref:serine hydrolase domain-containing protein n=1 Tax=Agromyces sp. 3263 TaxID=2817750 RepID=UPI0028573FA3|nr:serine hydrolase domain-containing protein [Agromyces sp. 3263]MDR6906332.1 CubicO group peptidase (beta-lactamase class C family) [Agromyces sp. 3263]
MFGEVLVAISALVLVTGCTAGGSSPSAPPGSDAAQHQTADPEQAEAVMEIVRDYMEEAHLKAVIVRATVDGEEIVRAAVGDSMTGVPATPDMHFRNGAVAISYVATLLLQLVDEGMMTLDDPVSMYLPDLPHADEVTVRQLAQMTSGYQDFVLGNEEFAEIAYADVFKAWTTEDQLALAVDKPLWFEPGTNWAYAHTNYVILGLVLEEVTGMPLEDALQQRVLDPLGLTNTTASLTAEIPEPVLHAYSSERRSFFGIPAGTPFYEDSTSWNPSWTIAQGAIETSNIDDLLASAIAVGTGELLSEESYDEMTSTDLRGRTSAIDGCVNCRPLDEFATYGLGLWISGDWLLQNPLFYGYAAVNAYLPSEKVAIAVAVTYDEAAFDDEGGYSNGGDELFRRIGAYLAPDDAPPVRPAQ